MLVEFRRGTRTPKLSGALRAADAARRKRARTGLTPRGDKLWTPAEDPILRKLYPDYASIRKRLRRRTKQALEARVRTLGLQRRLRKWTAAELSLLRKMWPSATEQQLLDAFPGASFSAIKGQAQRFKLSRRPRLLMTGKPLVDEVRQRARAMNYTMPELDCLAKSGSYFQSNCFINHVQLTHVYSAVRRLGGVIRIQWKD